MQRIQGTPRVAVLLAGVAALVVAVGLVAGQAGADSGTFDSTWDIKGTARQVEFGPARLIRTARHTGTIAFRSGTGLVGTVMTSCVSLNDTGARDTGRCVWVTQEGAKLFSEISGKLPPGGESGEVVGTFVGGTGRFERVSGSYSLNWVARPNAEPDGFAAQTVRMSGSWRTP